MSETDSNSQRGIKEALAGAGLEALDEVDAELKRAGDGITCRGFMCLTDWEHEIGHATDGNKVYPSLKALKEHMRCWNECGVIEVEVRAIRIAVPQNFDSITLAGKKLLGEAPDA